MAGHKSNHDFAKMINRYWGREVVQVVKCRRDVPGKMNEPVMDKIVSTVGPWLGGLPPLPRASD